MTRDEVVELAAKTAHEINLDYCLALGDYSQVGWDKAPKWQKESVLAGVWLIMDNPELEPEVSHAAWMDRKISEGWKHGPVKDVAKKEHPCLLPFDKLPPDQRLKDIIFGSVVRGILVKHGLIGL